MMLYRSSYYNRGNPDGPMRAPPASRTQKLEVEESEIMIAKHRNGPTGTIHLGFMRRYATFTELDQVHEE